MPRNLSEEDVEAFRARLCGVAERLFAEHGYEGVSLRALADELGVSRMTPYRYFQDKNAIFAEVRAAAHRRFAAAQEKSAAEHSEPGARLLALGRAYIEFGTEQPDAYRLMFELSQPDPDRHPELIEAGQRSWTPLRDAVAAAVEAGALEGDVDALAHGFWAGVHGLVSLHLAGKLAHGSGIGQLADPVLHQLFFGAARAAAHSDEQEDRS